MRRGDLKVKEIQNEYMDYSFIFGINVWGAICNRFFYFKMFEKNREKDG